MTIFILVLLFVPLCSSANLPEQLSKCKRSDPNFSNCLIKNANEAINLLAKENSYLHLESLDLINVGSFKNIPASPSLNLTMEHLVVFGLEKTLVTGVKFTDNQLVINSKIPQYGSVSEYAVNGQVLKADIYGNGGLQVNYSNADIEYKADLTIVEKNEKKYYSIQKHNLVIREITHVNISLSNLFDGDKTKGSAANIFIQDNSMAAFNEVTYALNLVLDTVYTKYISAFQNLIPINKLIDD